MVVPIPDGISWEVAGSIQPPAVAIQLAQRASFNANQNSSSVIGLKWSIFYKAYLEYI